MNEVYFTAGSKRFLKVPEGSDALLLLPAETLSSQIERERRRVSKHNRRAVRRGLEGTLELREWLAIPDDHGWSCAFCRGPFESIEHVTPLHMGEGTTRDNCVPACEECNQLRDWAARGVAAVATARQEGRLDVIADLMARLAPALVGV